MVFKKWEEQNEDLLVENYRYYLNDTCLRDENFDLKNTENYWEFAKQEYRGDKDRKKEGETILYS